MPRIIDCEDLREATEALMDKLSRLEKERESNVVDNFEALEKTRQILESGQEHTLTDEECDRIVRKLRKLQTSMADLRAQRELERLATEFQILVNKSPYSRRKLAKRAETSLSQVQRLLKGEAPRMVLHNLVRFANALDYDLIVTLAPRVDPDDDREVSEFVESRIKDRPRTKLRRATKTKAI